MSRPVTLDPAAPMRSLRKAAGLTQEQMAEARGITQGAVSESESSGGAVSVAKLAEAAAAVGKVLEIRIRPA